jgi:hypothetical protein
MREGCRRQEKRWECQWGVGCDRTCGGRQRVPTSRGTRQTGFLGQSREMSSHTIEHAREQINDRHGNAAYMQPISKREWAGLVRLTKGREIVLRVRYLAVHFKCQFGGSFQVPVWRFISRAAMSCRDFVVFGGGGGGGGKRSIMTKEGCIAPKVQKTALLFWLISGSVV